LEVTENGMTTKYQPNGANQYAKIAHGTEVVEPEYDPQGNLLHDATRQYTWDADIHLMSVTTQGSPHSPSEHQGTTGAAGRGATGSVASRQASGLPHNALDEAPSKTTTSRFLYDPLHRRIARVKDSGEVTLYVYEGWNVVSEKTTPTAPQLDPENFKLETRHVWGEDLSGSLQGAGGIGGLLRSVNSTDNRELRTENIFHYDSNGNVILLTDGRGWESARYAYDAFGKTLTATGSAAQSNRYRFSTKPVEEESGLVYYGYRWYDPVTGRWPSRDPIEERGGVNLYGLLMNSALNKVDKFGLCEVGGICYKIETQNLNLQSAAGGVGCWATCALNSAQKIAEKFAYDKMCQNGRLIFLSEAYRSEGEGSQLSFGWDDCTCQFTYTLISIKKYRFFN